MMAIIELIMRYPNSTKYALEYAHNDFTVLYLPTKNLVKNLAYARKHGKAKTLLFAAL